MEEQKPVDGRAVNFSPKSNGERQDCAIDLELADFKGMKMGDVQMGHGNASLLSLRQMVKHGRPAVVFIIPPGMKFEASDQQTFVESLKRLGDLKPIIMVFGGK